VVQPPKPKEPEIAPEPPVIKPIEPQPEPEPEPVPVPATKKDSSSSSSSEEKKAPETVPVPAPAAKKSSSSSSSSEEAKKEPTISIAPTPESQPTPKPVKAPAAPLETITTESPIVGSPGGRLKGKKPDQRKAVPLASLFAPPDDGSDSDYSPSGSGEESSGSGSEGDDVTPKDTLNMSLGNLGNALDALKMLDDGSGSGSGTGRSGSDSEESESGTGEESSSEEEGTKGLIKGFHALDDMNKAGLTRAKKFSTVKGKKVLQNEDTHYVESPFQGDPDVSLFCIFDGHGGKQCSEALVEAFPRIFKACYNAVENPKSKNDFNDFWLDVYAKVDNDLRAIEDCQYVGATCTTVLIWKCTDGKRYIQCANVGDSSAFAWVNGQSKMLNIDHKVTEETERQRLISEGVKINEGQTRLCGLSICRAMGDHFLKDEDKKTGFSGIPYICPPLCIETQKVKQLVMASDGLWDIVPGRNVFTITKDLNDPEEGCKKLIKAVLSSSSADDNVTVIVVDF